MLELDPDSVVWSHEESTTLCSEGYIPTDIWSKFDFILTPPRTPLRDTDFDLDNFGTLPEDLDLGLDANDLPLLEDDLEIDLDFLNHDMPLPSYSDLGSTLPTLDFPPEEGIACSHGQVHDTCSSCEKLALAGSELRHDCMWIGTCAATDAHANQKGRAHLESTCSHITDLLMDSSKILPLDDLHDSDDDQIDDDESDSVFLYNHMARPDTPSESSETDSDEEVDKTNCHDFGVVHEEEVYTSGSPSSSGMVHSDHTYTMPPQITHPKAHVMLSPSLLHTPSDSEDEIDVVGGTSIDDAYSCYTRPIKRSADRSQEESPAKKSKSFISTSEGSNKVLRISTSSLPTNPSSKTKKQLQEAVAESVKLKPRKASAKGQSKSTKRQQRIPASGGSRKKHSPRPESEDPEKREMHNSLERMRRVDLRNAFEELRVLIPDLQEKEKAPKVEILKKASQYCYQICHEEQVLLAQAQRERRYRNSLLKRLQALQRQGRISN